MAAQLRGIKQQENRTGIREVTRESTKYANGLPVVGQNGNPIVESHATTEQDELEKMCMEEEDRRSRMLEKSPPMTEPLVDLL
eukprot:6610638-Ditylum_brightwellii.AAC.1